MGNCQANDAAAVVIHHSNGHAERLYWPTTADVFMRDHPDHQIAHITFSGDGRGGSAGCVPSVGFTKIRFLKHREMLLIGQVYRLMTSEEVAKEMKARKQERKRKVRNVQVEQQQVQLRQHFLQLLELHNRRRVQERVSIEDSVSSVETDSQTMEEQAERHDREKLRSCRTWRPSLDSISEFGS